MSDQLWSVQLSPGAIRTLERLPHKVAAAIAEFITNTLPSDPYTMSKPLRFELEGWRVARRGRLPRDVSGPSQQSQPV